MRLQIFMLLHYYCERKQKMFERFIKTNPIKMTFLILMYCVLVLYSMGCALQPKPDLNLTVATDVASGEVNSEDIIVKSNSIQTQWGEYTLSKREIECLTLNVYHEARGEGVKGMIAVAMVTVNRAASGHMGAKNVCHAVMQKKQFSWTMNPTLVKKWMGATKASELALVKNAMDQYLNGQLLPHLKKATHYHEASIKPTWAKSGYKVAAIKSHVFYSIQV